jgi:hypothetical protein
MAERREKRQASDPLDVPTSVAGISSGALTVGTDMASETSLAFDSAASDVHSSVTAPPFAITSNPVTTTTPSTTSDLPSSSSIVSANASTPIPMSTVIGACVGAFVGAVALILLGLWFYRRSAQGMKKPRSRGHPVQLSNTRNAQREHQRSRSRLEVWDKLEDGDDKWEGIYQTKGVDNLGPMEKLTMFKSSPSIRTTDTQKSEETPMFDLNPHPFAQYHPQLAKDLSEVPPRPFLGRTDVTPTVSWDGQTLGHDSFLSLQSSRASGAMSPTMNMAIPTPPATASEPHHWQSAEVVDYGGESAEVIEDPFISSVERNKTYKNPFFNAQDYKALSKSPQGSARTKGKQRAHDLLGYDSSPPLKPPHLTHAVAESTSSMASNERAMQSLIAALDISPEEVQERLRVASMQPSVMSATSTYEEADVTSMSAFPLPPPGRTTKP